LYAGPGGIFKGPAGRAARLRGVAMNGVGQVLVTGASGFVGSAVAKALVEAGYSVRALVRPTSPRAHLDDIDVEFVEGDLRNAESVQRALAGVRYLFHVAADYRLWARDPSEITEVNVAGTRTIMAEALRAGVERVIYTSSVATIALGTNGALADESQPLEESKAIGAYKRSKVAAERLVEEMIAKEKLPAVIVNPSTPVGPRDVRPTPTGRLIVEAASGKLPCYIDTGLNLVHVDDVAAGHVAALQQGCVGERYILGGENVRFRDILKDICEIVGRRSPRWRIPRQAIMPVALAVERYARLTGREPFVTMDGLRMAKYRMFFNTSKAQRELGFRARPYRDGLADAVAWFQKAGYIR
jgi:dihydroflavonol-4-reductase